MDQMAFIEGGGRAGSIILIRTHHTCMHVGINSEQPGLNKNPVSKELFLTLHTWSFMHCSKSAYKRVALE